MIGAPRSAPRDLRRSRRRSAAFLVALVLGAAGVAAFSDGAAIKAKAALAQILLERAWAKTLAGEERAAPWPWADVWPVLKIEAPRLGKAAIALSGVSGEAMAFGPGVMAGGPVPGEPGTTIIAAHRDTHFRFLKDVRSGDAIIVTRADGGRLVFEVAETQIVNANRSGLVFEGDEPLLALITCWPFDAVRQGDERYVVVARLSP